MEINTLLMAGLLAFISNSTGTTSLPDLCDDIYLDAAGTPIHDAAGVTLSRYCEQTGLRAPKWDRPVCCSFDADGAHCNEPNAVGGCDAGQANMWCDHGERGGDGQVVCYQPLPSACAGGTCVAPPPGTPLEQATPLCCFPGGCYELDFGDDCEGFFGYCFSPYSNEDGTVGCADDE